MIALTALLVLLVILVLAIPVAAGLGWLGLVLNALFSPLSLVVTVGEVAWSSTTSFILVAISFGILFFLPALVGIANLVFCILGGIKANNGEAYRYPFALRLIK